MRKILSIVIAVLMVSMMIPSMAFASTAITAEAVTGLVAGETFTYEVAVANGAAEATMTVNAKVFNFDGTGSAENVEAKNTQPVVDGKATFTVNVSTSVPVTLDSNVKITAGSESVIVVFSIADRLIGDVNGKDGVTIVDATQIARYRAGLSVAPEFKECAGDVNGKDGLTIVDATQIARYRAGLSVTNQNMGVNYIGGEAAASDFDNIVTEDETPDVPPAVEVGEVSELFAYYQNGTVYYTFKAGANAKSYEISVNGEAVELSDDTATSGSFACANWIDSAENTIAVVAKADGATDSAAVTKVIEVADANGTLAAWLTENGLNDVTITVYEIE